MVWRPWEHTLGICGKTLKRCQVDERSSKQPSFSSEGLWMGTKNLVNQYRSHQSQSETHEERSHQLSPLGWGLQRTFRAPTGFENKLCYAHTSYTSLSISVFFTFIFIHYYQHQYDLDHISAASLLRAKLNAHNTSSYFICRVNTGLLTSS